ncbi:hypothetical protein P280DRAFT_528508 [Massarina eburnea CBS 473.64]|uniref:Uncharacterized protein n=1 Tax=Massarina eburnea CBS 473.64 TaxID=1395130 RepID=A0A6A6RXS6_9PLEO|nr:hypothetical protein P280DRAFT_528508 [Massarina eburnea CBS 473.64]
MQSYRETQARALRTMCFSGEKKETQSALGPIVTEVTKCGLLAVFHKPAEPSSPSPSPSVPFQRNGASDVRATLVRATWARKHLVALNEPTTEDHEVQPIGLYQKKLDDRIRDLEAAATATERRFDSLCIAKDQQIKNLEAKVLDVKAKAKNHENMALLVVSAAKDLQIRSLEAKVAKLVIKDEKAQARIASRDRHIRELDAKVKSQKTSALRIKEYQTEIAAKDQCIRGLSHRLSDAEQQVSIHKTELTKRDEKIERLLEKESAQRKDRNEIGRKFMDRGRELSESKKQVAELKEALVAATARNNDAYDSASSSSPRNSGRTSESATSSVSSETSASTLNIEPLVEDIVEQFEESHLNVLEALRILYQTQVAPEEIDTLRNMIRNLQAENDDLDSDNIDQERLMRMKDGQIRALVDLSGEQKTDITFLKRALSMVLCECIQVQGLNDYLKEAHKWHSERIAELESLTQGCGEDDEKEQLNALYRRFAGLLV